jgi:hypothetical protein
MSDATGNMPERPVTFAAPVSGRNVFAAGAVSQCLLEYAARTLGALPALGCNPEFAAQIPQRFHAVAGGTAYILATDLLT